MFAMRELFYLLASTILWICLLCQSAVGQVSVPQFAPNQQLVVLQNGEVLTGRITETATNTIVETQQGSRLVLSNERVEFVCDSIQDAYWGKCARTKANDVAGQKSLFYWCLKHGLHEQAQNQILLLAESKKVKSSDIEYLDRQLSVSITQLNKRNQDSAQLAKQTSPAQTPIQSSVAASHPPTDSSKAGLQSKRHQPNEIAIDSSLGMGSLKVGSLEMGLLVENDIDFNTFRPLPTMPALNALAKKAQPASLGSGQEGNSWPLASSDQGSSGGQQMIRQVGFEEEIDPQQIEQRHKTISLDHKLPNPIKPQPSSIEASIPTNAELDHMTRSMPSGTIGRYRSRLERVLINGCSAANCHDSHAQVLPLMDLGRSKPIPRRMSQRNLHQTLKYIDRSNPFASPLLSAASQAHGGGEKSVLPLGSKHFEQLKLWVIMLSDDPEENYQAYLNPALQKKLAVEKIEESPIEEILLQQDIVPVEPERIGLRPLDPIVEHTRTIGEIPELDNQGGNYQPVDPFDPEIFNRRFGEQRAVRAP